MRQPRADVCLSIRLLLFIRDSRPTEAALLEWLGASDWGCYYVLKRGGVVILRNGIVELSSVHLSEDCQTFYYGNRMFWLDEGRFAFIYVKSSAQSKDH